MDRAAARSTRARSSCIPRTPTALTTSAPTSKAAASPTSARNRFAPMTMKITLQKRMILALGGMMLFAGTAGAAGPGRPAWSAPVKPAWTKPLAPAWQSSAPKPAQPPPPPAHRHVPRRPPHPAPPPPLYTEMYLEAPQPTPQPVGVQPPQPPAPLTIHYDFRRDTRTQAWSAP